jgi:hypothetical protein
MQLKLNILELFKKVYNILMLNFTLSFHSFSSLRFSRCTLIPIVPSSMPWRSMFAEAKRSVVYLVLWGAVWCGGVWWVAVGCGVVRCNGVGLAVRYGCGMGAVWVRCDGTISL